MEDLLFELTCGSGIWLAFVGCWGVSTRPAVARKMVRMEINGASLCHLVVSPKLKVSMLIRAIGERATMGYSAAQDDMRREMERVECRWFNVWLLQLWRQWVVQSVVWCRITMRDVFKAVEVAWFHCSASLGWVRTFLFGGWWFFEWAKLPGGIVR